MADRIESGIMGLDGKIGGGFVRGSANLITGKTGTGKTAFSSCFIRQGALNGEPGVFITTEEDPEDIRGDVRETFSWDFEEMDDMVRIDSVKPVFSAKESEDTERLVRGYVSSLLDDITEAIEETDAERLVIDSESMIEMFIEDRYLAKVALIKLMDQIKETGVTAVITGTIPEESGGLSGSGIIEYVADSVIKLDYVPVAEEYKRTLLVRKMRRTDHSTLVHPFRFEDEGVAVLEV